MKLLLVLLSAVYSNIIALNHKNFDDFIAENPFTLI